MVQNQFGEKVNMSESFHIDFIVSDILKRDLKSIVSSHIGM